MNKQDEYRPMKLNRKRVREGLKKWYQAMIDDVLKPQICKLPPDWRNRILRVRK